jgi:hypothetical protein
MMNNKSQITLFLLVAIVIIGGVIFFAYPRQTPATQYDDLQKGATIISKSDSLKSYVESCLEQATKDAVQTLGLQGGYIYETQVPGTLIFFGPGGKLCGLLPTECINAKNIIPYNTRLSDFDNVSYAIKAPPKGFLPPEYPYKGSLRASDNINTFGIVTGGETEGGIVELCYLNGPNDAGIVGAKYSCFNSYSTLGKSIQSFLERYIENRTLGCVDFASLKSLEGVEIEPKNLTAKVLIGDNDLIATINYELLLRFSDTKLTATKSLKTMADFSYTMPKIRLKQTYELAYYLAQAETTNLLFDITSERSINNLMRCTDPIDTSMKTSCLKQGMEVKLIRDPCPGCEVNGHSDILQIIDKDSDIGGYPFVFQFGIANRPPALDLIDKNISQNTLYYNYLVQIGKADASKMVYKKKALNDPSYGTDQNIILSFNDELEIYPLAIDPDQTPVIFNYQGRGTDPIGQRLSESSIFASTRCSATIPLGPADIGEHRFRLVVSDNEDGTDWQDINVFVCDSSPDCIYCSDCSHCTTLLPIPEPAGCEQCEACQLHSPLKYCCT